MVEELQAEEHTRHHWRRERKSDLTSSEKMKRVEPKAACIGGLNWKSVTESIYGLIGVAHLRSRPRRLTRLKVHTNIRTSSVELLAIRTTKRWHRKYRWIYRSIYRRLAAKQVRSPRIAFWTAYVFYVIGTGGVWNLKPGHFSLIFWLGKKQWEYQKVTRNDRSVRQDLRYNKCVQNMPSNMNCRSKHNGKQFSDVELLFVTVL